ncbi:hypothetical protein F8568_030330 [Actinomadura sp. LD22]|uniref:Uncharacterized protein n=1 Tax=Actinomadura physcomitrii TaxID=2650748 RepID=A0A6I4MI59_9ACTN|nr:hypothetical protein [Actinomadura physcomitrii]MWA04600.1 hypothetical protein [Actinomadura physcomitrii]
MKLSMLLALTGLAVVALAFILGLWPVHYTVNGVPFSCGSALRPHRTMDSYTPINDIGGLVGQMNQGIDASCDTARSTPTFLARVAGFTGIALLLAAGAARRYRVTISTTRAANEDNR